MPPKNKRVASGTKPGPAKKQRTMNFKMREIPNAPGPSSAPQEVMKDARSYQVYELNDGRLGMRRGDAKVSVGQGNTVEEEQQTADLTAAIVDEYQHNQPSEVNVQHSKRRTRGPRPELRAAVRTRLCL